MADAASCSILDQRWSYCDEPSHADRTRGKDLEIGKGYGDCSIKWFDTYPDSIELLETVADIHFIIDRSHHW